MEAEKTADPSADPDPIIASYKVYANPALATGRKLLIMQHPNQQGPINYPHAQISGMRIKNRSGMIEVDVPISHALVDYDRDKGQRWGGALAKSLAAKSGGTHGLAGGFGVGVSTMRPSKRRDEFERDIDMMDWSEAVRQDKVLRTKTLGGQLPPESETECQWMVGVFKGDHLHLTPASALIQLRPQLHHIDAMNEQERASRREGAGAMGGKDGVPATTSSAGARAIHMSIKSADSGSGELTTETMADRLRTVQTEAWSSLQYEDDESAKSWAVFSNNLVYRNAKKPAADQANDEEKGKGKGKEKEIDVIQIDSSSSSDSEQLQAQWEIEDYLKAISAMKNGPEGSQKLEDTVEIKQEGSMSKTATGASAKGKGPATPGPASAARRTANAKGKSVAFKGTDMEVDS
ncbi:Sin-like protein conserved region-domain-containing protein [Xylaria bambusicola]|uniref:Sin-like protein conserved region-domain-containing protein n=1 Tax=Xylaria bambusicola TaxID=326684 RepID=UPI002008874C|nr:Sin-like protein conserved region-domain-containing protein [Xylaria bambusicola]KAI0514757.1 Sin-like protein conserved region-domain-containing protein [Xylaria bambusicola]